MKIFVFPRLRRIGILRRCLLSVVLWGSSYGLMVFFNCGYGLQFLVTLSGWLFGASVIGLCVKGQEAKPFELRKRNIIDPIADSTLEVYLLQIGIQSFMPGLPYAVGIPCFWISALAGGPDQLSLRRLPKGVCRGGP